MDEKIKNIVIDTVNAMKDLADEERVEVFIEINDFYCIHCGIRTHGKCYCQHDE